MSKGFRKSLFGFNTNDVLAYIAASDKAAKLKTDELNGKIAELSARVAELSAENAELAAKNAEFEAQKEQIRLMSESVAKMYLSAKATSRLMIEKAEESRRLIAKENEDRLSTIEKTNDSMLSVGRQITTAAAAYCEELRELCASLEAIKKQIGLNERATEEAIEEFDGIVSKNI